VDEKHADFNRDALRRMGVNILNDRMEAAS
jgi:hypothetical protein